MSQQITDDWYHGVQESQFFLVFALFASTYDAGVLRFNFSFDGIGDSVFTSISQTGNDGEQEYTVSANGELIDNVSVSTTGIMNVQDEYIGQLSSDFGMFIISDDPIADHDSKILFGIVKP